jgi:hypothetical protein
MPSSEPKKASGPLPVDDGLDKIPMQKTSPVWIVAGVVLVLVVGGLAVFSFLGGKKATPTATQPTAPLSAEPESQSLDQKAQREHQAMTLRAMAALEEKKKEQSSTDQASSAEAPSQKPEGDKPKAAGKRAGGGPAPGADKLNDIGKNIESALKQ